MPWKAFMQSSALTNSDNQLANELFMQRENASCSLNIAPKWGIRSLNYFVAILEKPKHFLPKSLMDAPMWYTQFAALLFFYFICHIYIHFSNITNCDFEHYHI